MLESILQSKIVTELKKLGWFSTKITLCSTPGFPDLLAVKDGETIYIEVKREGEQPRPKQKRVHDILKHFGAKVYIVDSIDKFNKIIDQWQSQKSH